MSCLDQRIENYGRPTRRIGITFYLLKINILHGIE